MILAQCLFLFQCLISSRPSCWPELYVSSNLPVFISNTYWLWLTGYLNMSLAAGETKCLYKTTTDTSCPEVHWKLNISLQWVPVHKHLHQHGCSNYSVAHISGCGHFNILLFLLSMSHTTHSSTSRDPGRTCQNAPLCSWTIHTDTHPDVQNTVFVFH